MTLTRRTFLAVAGAAAAGLAGIRRLYSEPLEVLSDAGDWIEDKGDYVVIRVPDFKTFAHETINKPAIILLGEAAEFRDVLMTAVCNIAVPKGGKIKDCIFDARSVATENMRSVVRIKAERLDFSGAQIYGGVSNDFGIYLGDGSKDCVLSHVSVTMPPEWKLQGDRVAFAAGPA